MIPFASGQLREGQAAARQRAGARIGCCTRPRRPNAAGNASSAQLAALALEGGGDLRAAFLKNRRTHDHQKPQSGEEGRVPKLPVIASSFFGRANRCGLVSFRRLGVLGEASNVPDLFSLSSRRKRLKRRRPSFRGARHPTGGTTIPVPAARLVTSAPSRQNRKEKTYGDQCRHDAAIARGRSAFRPPDPPLEPPDEAVHFRRPQRGPHHRPVADRAAVRARARLRPADRRPRRQGAVRRHQAPGAGCRSPKRRAVAASISSTTAGSAAC